MNQFKFKVIGCLAILTAISFFAVNTVCASTDKKENKIIYYSSCLSKTKGDDKEQSPGIKKIVFRKDRVILYASLKKAVNPSDFWVQEHGKTTWCKYKQRTFKLSKKVKYCSYEEDREVKVPADEFQNTCKRYNYLGLEIKVKNNKIVKKTLYSWIFMEIND